MKITYKLFLILLTHSSMAALVPLNHLIPADNFGGFYSNTKYITTADLNIDNEDEGYLLQFISYPSFDLMSSTVIIQNYETGEYRVAYSTKKRAKRKYSKRNIKTTYRKISKETSVTMHDIYEKMLIETHYQNVKTKTIGLDGTTYEFYVDSSNHGSMFGTTWSPDENTDTYYLVKSSEVLNQYILGKVSEDDLNESLNSSLKLLNITKKKTTPLEYLSSEFKSQEPYLHCNTEEFVSLVATASMTIQEIAFDEDIKEHDIGAIMMIWRMEACELLHQNAELYTDTRDAIEKECTKIIRLKGNNEKEYIEDARKYLTWHKNPSHVVLSWAKEHEDSMHPMHTVIATDGVEGIRVEYPGYGHKGDIKVNCIKKPEKIFYF